MSLVDVVPLPQRLTVSCSPARAHLARALLGDLDQASREAVEAATAVLDDLEQPRRFEIRDADGGDSGVAELLIYSEIGGWFGGAASEFAEQLAGITAKNLTVRLNSPGGSVWEGLAMANLLRSHSARVKVMVDGIAASIASVIMLAGDEIEIGRQAQVMIHDAMGVTLGNPADHREMADLLDRQSDNIAAAYRDRAGGRIDTWRNRMRAETWFLGEEAVAVGLADRIAPAKKKAGEEPDPGEEEAPATAAKAAPKIWDLSVFRYAGREAAPDPLAEPPKATADDKPEPGPAETDAEPAAAIDPDQLAAAMRTAIRDELRAAGVGIEATACPSHDTAVEEGAWDAGAQEKRMSWPIPVATAKRMYGWYDESQVEDGKLPRQACKLPHHFVSENGTPGAASVSGIRAALGRLDQTHGPSDAEKAMIRSHLRGHLSMADDNEDRDAPPATEAGQPTPEQPPAPVFAFGRPQPDRPFALAFGKGGQHQ